MILFGRSIECTADTVLTINHHNARGIQYYLAFSLIFTILGFAFNSFILYVAHDKKLYKNIDEVLRLILVCIDLLRALVIISRDVYHLCLTFEAFANAVKSCSLRYSPKSLLVLRLEFQQTKD